MDVLPCMIKNEESEMKKRGFFVLSVFFIALQILFYGLEIQATDSATDRAEDSAEESTEESTEEEIPKSYYIPIESNAIEGWPQGPPIEAESAVVMDAISGGFLYSKNAEEKRYPASVTKILTALVAIEHGDLDKTIRFSRHAVYDIERDSSHIGIQPEEKMTLRQALYALMLESANDAANGIAEEVGGTIEEFVQMMNDKATELGCINSHFSNAHGLHEKDHYTCAKDMALITQAAIKHDVLREIMGTVEYQIPETNKVKEIRYLVNHHRMIRKGQYQYKNCLGGKTGFTSDALNTLVTVAERENMRLICVTLKVNGSEKTFKESTELLNYGFDYFKGGGIVVSDGKQTWADLMHHPCLGVFSGLQTATWKESVYLTEDIVQVVLPREVDYQKINRILSTDGTLTYTYADTPVGRTFLRFNIAAFLEIQKEQATTKLKRQEAKAIQEQKEKETAQAIEAQGGIVNQIGAIWEQIVETIQSGLHTLGQWIYQHDWIVAAVVLFFIVLLVPILIIAYIRSRRSNKIRKMRKQEREERIKVAEDIATKSVSEIESELRAGLESAKEKSVKEEPAKEESAKEESVKEEPAKEESAKEESVKEETAKEKSAKGESVKEESVKGKSVKEESVKEESAKEESAKEESAKEESKDELGITN